MADYAFKFKAQAWRRDSYYMGSSQPVKELTVIATTEAGGKEEARRVLGSIDSAWYWRFWLVESQDVRLLAPAVPGEGKGQ